MYLNEIKLIGFVGQDAELKSPQNSKELVRFDVATKASWKNCESGAYDSRTEWHCIVVWGNLTKFAQTLKKGEHVYVSTDAGTTWTEPGPIPLSNVNGVAAAPGVITVAGFGATPPVLISSFDGGRSWSTTYDGPAQSTIGELGFTTPLHPVGTNLMAGLLETLLIYRRAFDELTQ